MSWYQRWKVRIAVVAMVVVVLGVAVGTPGSHNWLWIPLILAVVAWHMDSRRRREAER